MCSVLRQSLAKRTMGLANQQLLLRHVGQSLDSSGKVGSVREGGPVGSGIQIPCLFCQRLSSKPLVSCGKTLRWLCFARVKVSLRSLKEKVFSRNF